MFGKIVYIGDSEAHVENLQKEAAASDLMNMNVIFEENNQRILFPIYRQGGSYEEISFLAPMRRMASGDAGWLRIGANGKAIRG